jgi:N6-adenosine-specific RNA methylase IME4
MSRALVKRSSSLPAHVLADKVVKRLIDAEQALAAAVQIDQVKLVMDVAAAQEVFAKRQKLGEDVIGYAHAIKTRALARLGELLQALQKATGGEHGGRKRIDGSRLEPSIKRPTLSETLGVSPAAAKKIAHVAQQLAALPPSTREEIAQREKTLAEARRETKAVEVRRAVSLPTAKHRVIYADPPWSYNDKADAGSVQSGGAARHYPTMSIAELCAMPVASICADDAVLFLWVTSPLLFEAAAVIRAWGFSYKASFVWDKVRHNMGHYNSVRHEFLLICTKGSCTPDHVELFDSVQSIEKTTHSTKPPEFRRIIDTLYPHGKRIELFARERVPGWDAFGFEAQPAAESVA